MLKQMLSGTAVALLMVATPAMAQTADEAEEPQAEETAPEMEMQDTETDALDDAPDDAMDLDEELDTEDEAEAVEEDVVEEDVAEAERPEETYLSMQEEEDTLASELMGVDVENPQGETLGSINDLVIHDEIGVKAVVVGVGGFLGLGQKHVAVNYGEIEHSRDPDTGDVTLVFSATQEELENAPEFQTIEDQIAEAEQQEMEMQQEAPALD